MSRLYSGGFVEKSMNVAIVGANQMIFDDINYYINLKELTFARISMNDNKDEIIKYFQPYIGKTKKEIVAKIINDTTANKILLDSVDKIMARTYDLCANIVDAALNNLGTSGLVLPNIEDIPYTYYDIESVYHVLESYYRFYSKLNISSIVGQIDIGSPPPKPIDMPVFNGLDMPSSLSDNIENFHRSIIDAAMEAKKIEKYYCDVINWLSKLLAVIDNIIDALTQKIKEIK